MKIGTPSWWSLPQPPAHSKVRRPATTAPVDMNSWTTCPLTPPRFNAGTPVPPASAPVRIHSCRRSPPSPRPLSGPSFGPVMNPSRDIDMDRTVADTRAFCPGDHIGARPQHFLHVPRRKSGAALDADLPPPLGVVLVDGGARAVRPLQRLRRHVVHVPLERSLVGGHGRLEGVRGHADGPRELRKGVFTEVPEEVAGMAALVEAQSGRSPRHVLGSRSAPVRRR